MLLFGIGTCLALILGWRFAGSAADQAYDRLLESAAVQLMDGVVVGGDRVEATPPDSAFDTLALAEQDRFFYAIRASGRLLTGYDALGTQASDQPQSGMFVTDSRYLGASVRLVVLKREMQAGDKSERIEVSVAQTKIARHAMRLQLFAQSAPVTVAISVLGLLASFLAMKLALRPLAILEAALQVRDPQDLTPLAIAGPLETVGLIDAINTLVHRLSLRLDKLQQLSRLTAHQMRTPLAALGSQVELLAAETDHQARRKRIDRLRARLSQFNRLIQQLLSHAMVAYRGDAAPRAMVDLTALVRATLSDFLVDADLNGREVVFLASDRHVHVNGDGVILREALMNLLTNALLHGAKGLVQVRIATSGQTVSVAVADDGPGMSRDQAGLATQPFSLKRQDSSGAGLGLSIVQEAAEAHGGKIAFGRDEVGMFEVRIILPLEIT